MVNKKYIWSNRCPGQFKRGTVPFKRDSKRTKSSLRRIKNGPRWCKGSPERTKGDARQPIRGSGWTQRCPGRSKSGPGPSERRLWPFKRDTINSLKVIQGGLREAQEGRSNRCKGQSKEGPLHSKRVKKGPWRRSRFGLGWRRKIQEGLNVVQDGLKEVKNGLEVWAIWVNLSNNEVQRQSKGGPGRCNSCPGQSNRSLGPFRRNTRRSKSSPGRSRKCPGWSARGPGHSKSDSVYCLWEV